MNYRKKRTQAKLSIYTMAKELGIDYKTMLEIDRGERNLDGEYITKFLKVLERATAINMSRNEKLFEVRNYFMTDEPKKDLKKLNYAQSDLPKMFDCSLNPISRTFNKKIAEVSDDFLERIYDFLHNYTNKKLETKIETDITNIKPITEEDLQPAETDIINFEIESQPIFMPVESIEPKVEIISSVSEQELEQENAELKAKISLLERQIYLYEKLIEKL